jgi:hypothetical protein
MIHKQIEKNCGRLTGQVLYICACTGWKNDNERLIHTLEQAYGSMQRVL